MRRSRIVGQWSAPLLSATFASASFAGFTPVLAPFSGEQSHRQILSHIYATTGGSFNESGAVDFQNTTLLAKRVDDFVAGGGPGSGTDMEGTALDGPTGGDDDSDQIWRAAFMAPQARAVFGDYGQEFGFLHGTGLAGGGGAYSRMFAVIGTGYDPGHTPIESLPLQRKALRWARRGGPPIQPPHPQQGMPRNLASQTGDNPDTTDHMVTYQIQRLSATPGEDEPLRWVIMWEDILTNEVFNDFDYNDLVVEIIAAPPPHWIGPNTGNWNVAGNWSGNEGAPNGREDAASLLARAAPTTIALDDATALTRLRFSSPAPNGYTITGTNELSLHSLNQSDSLLLVEQGSHTIATPLAIVNSPGTNAGGWVIDVAAGSSLTTNGPITFFNFGNLAIMKEGAGRWNTSALHADPANPPVTLQIDGGSVRLLRDGGLTRVNGLSIAGGATPTAQLDITNNPIVIDYSSASPIATIRAQIRSGFADGAWTGNGIISSMANSTQSAVGYGEASALASVPDIFGTVDNTTVLLRLTRYGDANLDGTVTNQDFNRLATNFGTTGKFWTDGDFNYDGNVNILDFNRLANNFGQMAPLNGALTPQHWAALAQVVPEPSIAGVCAIATLSLARRRPRGAQRH